MSRVLEAGCCVGAQTVTLAGNSPDARFFSIDISEDSVTVARRAAEAAGISNVDFQQGDIFHLPFGSESFDHIFLCFVLEPLPRPVEALEILKGYLKGGGTITVIEGVRETALAAGITEKSAFDRGIRDLYRTAEADGVFCYTFFKAVAVKG